MRALAGSWPASVRPRARRRQSVNASASARRPGAAASPLPMEPACCPTDCWLSCESPQAPGSLKAQTLEDAFTARAVYGRRTRLRQRTTLERRRLTADAIGALVFPSRDHEADRPQAPGQFLRGIHSRDQMRMQPRSARRGRHEHHDGADKAVKHAGNRAKPMPWPQRSTIGRFSGFASRRDYGFARSDTNPVIAPSPSDSSPPA